jgi:ATP-dependent HslUV protease, peptidase subunit HslV
LFESVKGQFARASEVYFLNPQYSEDDPFESSQLHCLIAHPYGISGFYSLRAVQQFTKFYAFGSGGDFALGAMRTVYGAGSNAEAIARARVRATAEFDDGTGLPIEIHTTKFKN